MSVVEVASRVVVCGVGSAWYADGDTIPFFVLSAASCILDTWLQGHVSASALTLLAFTILPCCFVNVLATSVVVI